jgi:hypothetical protein
MHMDVISRTISLAIISLWLLRAQTPSVVGILFLGGMSLALVFRVSRSVLLAAVFVPLLPILVSHFFIEPTLSGQPITLSPLALATTAWFRVSGLAIWSILWLSSIRIEEGARLCQLLFFGQYAFVPILVAGTFISVARERWIAIREFQSLFRSGLLRRRRRTRFVNIPSFGLQLMLASLISTQELSLSSGGRGIGLRRKMAVGFPRLSVSGGIVVALLCFGSWYAGHLGYATLLP